jgi:hypothetical protein
VRLDLSESDPRKNEHRSGNFLVRGKERFQKLQAEAPDFAKLVFGRWFCERHRIPSITFTLRLLRQAIPSHLTHTLVEQYTRPSCTTVDHHRVAKMPREMKKRGRRGDEKKRKLEEEEEVQQEFAQPKRQRTEDGGDEAADQQDFVALPSQDAVFANENGESQGPQVEQVFFGMLDEEEQEYFKRADEMLEMNNFADAEERSLFLANVYREANGKELKIANSQSCSRLMERLIQLSTPAQLKTLFQKFSGK